MNIGLSIESFKWLQNKIVQMQNKKKYVIRKDAFLSKGASNDEMGESR